MDTETKCNFIRWIIVILFIVTVILYFGNTCRLLRNNEKDIAIAQSEYTDKMNACVEEKYSFVVDGTEIAEVSNEFVGSSFGKYNVAYDDTGKKVIMTTLQPTPRNNSSIPFFFFLH